MFTPDQLKTLQTGFISILEAFPKGQDEFMGMAWLEQLDGFLTQIPGKDGAAQLSRSAFLQDLAQFNSYDFDRDSGKKAKFYDILSAMDSNKPEFTQQWDELQAIMASAPSLADMAKLTHIADFIGQPRPNTAIKRDEVIQAAKGREAQDLLEQQILGNVDAAAQRNSLSASIDAIRRSVQSKPVEAPITDGGVGDQVRAAQDKQMAELRDFLNSAPDIGADIGPDIGTKPPEATKPTTPITAPIKEAPTKEPVAETPAQKPAAPVTAPVATKPVATKPVATPAPAPISAPITAPQRPASAPVAVGTIATLNSTDRRADMFAAAQSLDAKKDITGELDTAQAFFRHLRAYSQGQHDGVLQIIIDTTKDQNLRGAMQDGLTLRLGRDGTIDFVIKARQRGLTLTSLAEKVDTLVKSKTITPAIAAKAAPQP